MRFDKYLVENNYFTSRTRAQNEIKEGNVYVSDKQITNPSFDYKDGEIKIVNPLKYVSRGGLKLEGAIKAFSLDFKDKTVLDIGASTGGFTDCALQHGAKRVYAVDVGSLQLSEILKNDPRVISMENTNILDTNITDQIDYIVMDVSFVSIKHLIPALKKYLTNSNQLVCLIKPQFEAGKMINKGIIKDSATHVKILREVYQYLNEEGLYINKLSYSPIKGGSGNIEYLALISMEDKGHIDINAVVEASHRKEW